MLAETLTRATVSDVVARRLRLPLTTPYKLAFGAIEAFDTVLVSLEVDGRTGYGEGTVLTGYTEETIEGSWALAASISGELEGRELREVFEILDRHLAAAPFTVTAFRTAIEMALGASILSSDEERRVAILKILNGSDSDAIAREIEEAVASGYRTLKIKVGFEVEADLARVECVQRAARGRLGLTIDANQGYSRDDGCHFARNLDPDSILFFEQACHKDDWEAAAAVAAVSRVPLMLDESIYDLDDVRRVADERLAQYVKLKLMKFGSLAALEAGLDQARSLGLRPVLGNGVASDIGCWMEACVAASHVSTAGEMNGFLKPHRPLVTNPLTVAEGQIRVPAGYRPQIDRDAVEDQTLASARA